MDDRPPKGHLLFATPISSSPVRQPPVVIRHFLLVILLAAFALRTAPLTQNRFHPDEALYATFARLIASGRDPLLSTLVVDKPPLPFYLMAASMTVFGGTELAARLPSLLASILTVALTFRLARTLYGRGAATLAALVLAASPLAILFAHTLFTDTLLAAFLLASLLLTARARWAAAGLMFGLAFAAKQTALFFLPLIAAFGLIRHFTHSGAPAPRSPAPLLKFLLPALLCTLIIFLWDSARQAPISFWTQGYSDNNPGRLIRSNELWPRLAAWADLLQYPAAPVVAVTAALAFIPLLTFNRRSLPALYDFLLSGFVLAFLALYWLLAFNIWDRYLVILAPLIALLIGRAFERLASFTATGLLPSLHTRIPVSGLTPNHILFIVHWSLVILLLPSALTAARSGYPIGGDHGAYDGIDEIAAALRTVPPGSVLYDFWLSWELGFYLFDGPAYVAWMPGPPALADDLRAFGAQSPRYIVSPSWESFAETQSAIEAAGYTAKPIRHTFRRDGSLSFTLYQLLPAQP